VPTKRNGPALGSDRGRCWMEVPAATGNIKIHNVHLAVSKPLLGFSSPGFQCPTTIHNAPLQIYPASTGVFRLTISPMAGQGDPA
jgi:hypothetical protein